MALFITCIVWYLMATRASAVICVCFSVYFFTLKEKSTMCPPRKWASLMYVVVYTLTCTFIACAQHAYDVHGYDVERTV